MRTLSIDTRPLQKLFSRSRGSNMTAEKPVKEDSQRGPREHGEEAWQDLRMELERFYSEKERVRPIVGQIGGMPKTRVRILHTASLTIIGVTLFIPIIGGEAWRLLMIEVASVALALKIIYLIHSQMRVAHFEFWMLSSLEWRINEIMKQLRELKRQTRQSQ